MIRGYIRGQSFRLTYPTMVSDTIAYREAEFFFDTPDWDGLVKWAHFSKGDEVYDVLLKDDKIVKGDNLDLSEGEWQVYLHGNAVVDGVVVERITTTVQSMKVLGSGVLEGEPLPVITPTVSEQVAAAAAEARSLAQSVRNDADNGLFQGEKGEKGDKGDKGERGDKGDKGEEGYTPQAGVDYYTEAEKEEFATEIRAYADEEISGVETAVESIPDIVDFTDMFAENLLSPTEFYDDERVMERLFSSGWNSTIAIIHHNLKDKAHLPLIKIPSTDPKRFRLCPVLRVTYGESIDAIIDVDFSQAHILRITEHFWWNDGNIEYNDSNYYELIPKSAEANAYTDEKVGDIEAALDGIIAIQEALIGGEGA